MTDKRTQEQASRSNMEKNPDEWVTGDEPMTGAQRSYLKTLCEEAREAFDESLTKAQASRRIDELQARTGRGGPQSANLNRTPNQHGPESPLESFGRAVSEPVLGSDAAPGADREPAEGSRKSERPGDNSGR